MDKIKVDPHRLEELINYCTGFAQEMLTKCGEFLPFGAVLKTDGELTAVGGYTGEEYPPGQDVYVLLQDSLKQDFADKKIEAAAIAADVNIPQKFNPPFNDGIRILIECEGYARMFYFPYSISKPSFIERVKKQRGKLMIAEVITVDASATLTNNN